MVGGYGCRILLSKMSGKTLLPFIVNWLRSEHDSVVLKSPEIYTPNINNNF